MEQKEEALKLIDTQTILNYVIIGVLVILQFVNYNEKLKINGEEPFWDEQMVKNISIFTRAVLLIVALVASYLAYKALEITKKNPDSTNKDVETGNLQLFAAGLAVVVALIVLYAIVRNVPEDQLQNVINEQF